MSHFRFKIEGGIMLGINNHVYIETKTVFICKLCGFSSENKSDLQTCMEKGKTNNFKQGERVEFRIENRDDSGFIWLIGVIVEVRLSEKIHYPSYMIRINENDRKKIFPFFWKEQTVIGEFYEEELSSNSNHVIRKISIE